MKYYIGTRVGLSSPFHDSFVCSYFPLLLKQPWLHQTLTHKLYYRLISNLPLPKLLEKVVASPAHLSSNDLIDDF